MRQLLSLVLGAVSFSVFAAVQPPCEVLLEASAVGRAVVVELGGPEMLATDIVLLPLGKFLFGTARPRPGGVAGADPGRLVVLDAATGVATTLPGPRRLMTNLELSPNATLLVALGGISFSGHDLSTDAQLYDQKETGRTIDSFVDIMTDVLRRAARGDAEALRRARGVDHNGVLLAMARSNPENLRGEVELQYLQDARGNGMGHDVVRDLQPINLHFHPKGDRYLVNYGKHVTVRDAKTGKQNKRIPLVAFDVAAATTWSVAYYLGGGSYVGAFYGRNVDLWNAETGRNASSLAIPDGVELFPGLSHASPAATAVAVPFSGREESGVGIWAERAGTLEWLNTIAVPKKYPAEFPTVAFSRVAKYAAAKTPGLVQIFPMELHAKPEWEFALGEDAHVQALALASQAQWVAVAFARGKEIFVELRNAKTKGGARVKLSDVTKVMSLCFDLEGGQLLVNAVKDRELRPYLIDVYKMLAAIPTPK